jgi:hypothetical protein
MFLCTANGHLGDDVFLLSDSTMGPEDFQKVEIRGLTHNSRPADIGWLCFTKTRCGNEKFFKWYLSELVPDFVDNIRLLLPEHMKDLTMYLVADGEEVQMKPVESDDINAILFEHKIDVGKGPASCTGTVGNACDRSNLFKASKKVLKSQNSVNENDYKDPILESSIYSNISTLRPNITPEKRSFLSKALVKITRSLAKVVNPQIVMHGFERIGVYPLNHKTCISNCDKTTLESIDADTIDHIISKIPELSKHFLDEVDGGRVTEAQMDAAGIPTIDNDDRRTTAKDERTQSKERAVLVSNPAARKRRKEWVLGREQKAAETETRKALEASGEKRKRAPNRPKHVIEDEKKAREDRRLEKMARTI